MRAKKIVVIRPLDRLVNKIHRLTLGGALILEVKSGQDQQMRGKPVISLVVKLVAVRDQVQPVRIHGKIGLAVVQERRPQRAIPVRALNDSRQAVIVAGKSRCWSRYATIGRYTDPGRVPLPRLLTPPRQPKLNAIVEARRGLRIQRSPAIEVLIALFAIVTYAIEIPGIWHPGGIHSVPQRGANLCISAGLPACIGYRSSYV